MFTPSVCNDNNVCTDDSCDTAIGCVFTNNTAACNDGNACTTNDICSNGYCNGTPIVCNDNNPCTTDTCDPATGNYVFTPSVCDDHNPCTADTCDPANGCVYTPIIGCVLLYTTGNNFTMNNPSGGILGGTNDVAFTWDGTVHATVTGVSNAAISSNEPFQNWLLYFHDVEIVGPVTWSVDLCPTGPGSCYSLFASQGTYFYEVTVPAGMIGAHMIFDWGQTNPFPLTSCCKAACDIDVWNVWDSKKAYAGLMCGSDYTSPALCGDYGQAAGIPFDTATTCNPVPPSVIDGKPNVQVTVWDLVSIDCAGRIKDSTGGTVLDLPLDGIPGMPMADGAFPGFNGNFNFMYPTCTGCLIGGTCYSNGEPNPANQCQACIISQSTTAWSNKANNTACNDNNICTGPDVCTDGVCGGPAIVPVECNDNNVCTMDGCSSNQCTHTNNTLPCDDGVFCNGADTCSNGTCSVHSGNPCKSGTTCKEATKSCEPPVVTGSDVGIISFLLPQKTKGCAGILPITVVAKNFGKTTVTGTMTVYKNNLAVKTWTGVKFYPGKYVTETFNYKLANDRGKVLSWYTKVNVPNDTNLSNNTSLVKTTTVAKCKEERRNDKDRDKDDD